jgi:hypothetical protein
VCVCERQANSGSLCICISTCIAVVPYLPSCGIGEANGCAPRHRLACESAVVRARGTLGECITEQLCVCYCCSATPCSHPLAAGPQVREWMVVSSKKFLINFFLLCFFFCSLHNYSSSAAVFVFCADATFRFGSCEREHSYSFWERDRGAAGAAAAEAPRY